MVLNFVLAMLPIIWLFVAFLIIKMPGYIGCLIALLISIVESLVFRAAGFSDILAGLSFGEALTATLEGVITALWPIGIIIIAAMLVNQMYEYAQSHGSVSESELYSAFMGQIALIYLFGFVETAGNIIALAGGISNHVKMANRRRTLERLRNLE